MTDGTVGDNSDDVTSDTNEDDRIQQLPLPVQSDILYVPLESYYYTDGSGPSVPKPDKKWHVKQQIISAKWKGKNKRRKYVITGIDDFGDKYERDWGVWKREAAVKFDLGNDEKLFEPHHKTWEIAGGTEAAIPYKQLHQSKPVPSSTSTAPKHVEQTALHAFRESFPA